MPYRIEVICKSCGLMFNETTCDEPWADPAEYPDICDDCNEPDIDRYDAMKREDRAQFFKAKGLA